MEISTKFLYLFLMFSIRLENPISGRKQDIRYKELLTHFERFTKTFCAYHLWNVSHFYLIIDLFNIVPPQVARLDRPDQTRKKDKGFGERSSAVRNVRLPNP